MVRDNTVITRAGRFQVLPVSGGNGKTGETVNATPAEILLTGAAISDGSMKYATIMSNTDIIFRQGAKSEVLGTSDTAKLLKNTYLQLLAQNGFDYLLFVRDTADGKLWIMYHDYV